MPSSDIPTQTAPDEDPRLIAYAKLIGALPTLLPTDARMAVCDWLAERQVLADGSEDPGAVITEGLETELAIAQTFRDIEAILRSDPTG